MYRYVYLTTRVLLVGVQDDVGISIVELSIVTLRPMGHLHTSALADYEEQSHSMTLVHKYASM